MGKNVKTRRVNLLEASARAITLRNHLWRFTRDNETVFLINA